MLSGGLRSDLGDLRARQVGADPPGEVGRTAALPAATPALYALVVAAAVPALPAAMPALYALEIAAAVFDDAMAAPVHDPAEATRPPYP